MKKLLIILISSYIICSCNTQIETNTFTTHSSLIFYKIADNYFVKNNYDIRGFTEKVISTENEFNQIFDMASFMGKNRKPTPIDFSREKVVVLLHPATNRSVELIPLKLEENEKMQAVYYYKLRTGEQSSFETKPKLIIIVSNDINKILFKKVD
ncbi:hypothetical protein WH221_01170 [Chryseobacterium culicis]|uniref:Lipoprotein n=1 Tax=Chryseobacterium culicis TaxID=680127 RepID=A0A2S9CWQ6_CHRCI|nr:hypothetical protein [Chryseobacterium culicis]PRB84901.1 hypothetical protein CQ022_01115 [Chryseobacterium culicis]PRB91375.1 hypothetical protein CQ033_11875 [Chryseobacterium culicis]